MSSIHIQYITSGKPILIPEFKELKYQPIHNGTNELGELHYSEDPRKKSVLLVTEFTSSGMKVLKREGEEYLSWEVPYEKISLQLPDRMYD